MNDGQKRQQQATIAPIEWHCQMSQIENVF